MAPAVPPSLLSRLAPGWTASLAYQLIPELTTWRLTHPDGRVRFAKVDTAGHYPTLAGEKERMVWGAAYLPVPVVVPTEEVDGATVLITEALPGTDGTDPEWRHDLPTLVRALGAGLLNFHRAVGEEWCPFRFDVGVALEHVRRRVDAGMIDPANQFHPEHRHLTATSALALLERTAPEYEDLVVCHGDYCPPNALLCGGKVTGYVDLGELGVADRWLDIAVGGWSAGWNFGAELEPLFYEGYGIEPEPDRIAFYRLLWECAS
jgi:kanamycin kinase